MTDFLSRIVDPEWLAAEREIASLRESLCALMSERGYITEGDVNQARAALHQEPIRAIDCIEKMARTMSKSCGIPYDDWRDYVPREYRDLVASREP